MPQEPARMPADSFLSICAAFEFAGGESYSFAYDAPGFYNSDDSCHCDTADAYEAGIVTEYFNRTKRGDVCCSVGAYQWYDDPPYED